MGEEQLWFNSVINVNICTRCVWCGAVRCDVCVECMVWFLPMYDVSVLCDKSRCDSAVAFVKSNGEKM